MSLSLSLSSLFCMYIYTVIPRLVVSFLPHIVYTVFNALVSVSLNPALWFGPLRSEGRPPMGGLFPWKISTTTHGCRSCSGRHPCGGATARRPRGGRLAAAWGFGASPGARFAACCARSGSAVRCAGSNAAKPRPPRPRPPRPCQRRRSRLAAEPGAHSISFHQPHLLPPFISAHPSRLSRPTEGPRC